MISFVIPVYNEKKNIPILADELRSLSKKIGEACEIIWVDDGSGDGSFSVLQEIASADKNFKVVSFKKNYGQTAALSAGFDLAVGETIVTMDSDLENDPKDVPKLLAKLKEGFSVVSGWRVGRWSDKPLTRKFPSYAANALISFITGVKLHDYGCMLKAYRKEALEGVKLYGEMHRFIPAYVAWQGGRVSELRVNHRPRIHGISKYGLSRTFKVLLDLLLIKFLFKYQDRPIHFFGGIGFVSMALSAALFLWALYYKLAGLKDFVATPLPTLGALFFIVGVNFILMGILAELFVRTYGDARDRHVYRVKDKINIQ